MPRADIIRVVAFFHVSELLGGGINAPELIAALASWDEHAVFVPAMYPCDAVVEAEETGLDASATLVFDFAGALAVLVVRFEEVAAQDAGPVDGDGLGEFGEFALGGSRGGCRGESIDIIRALECCDVWELVAVQCCDEEPSAAGYVLVLSWLGGRPVLRESGGSLDLWVVEPFVRGEDFARGQEEIWRHFGGGWNLQIDVSECA